MQYESLHVGFLAAAAEKWEIVHDLSYFMALRDYVVHVGNQAQGM